MFNPMDLDRHYECGKGAVEEMMATGQEPHNKGNKLARHQYEYDPSGAFRLCLACGAENPIDPYCSPRRYVPA